MNKTLKLGLNKYSRVPHSLRANPSVNSAAPSIEVDLANLYHHYYLDSFGKAPPSPDPVQFEHVQFLMPSKEFRFQGSGLGISPAIKRHRSNELGQAFCRWFLHDHLNITYFAHVEPLLGRQLHRPFEGFRIDRTGSGDTPDYFCADNVNQVFLAEAKGRYSSISFKNKEFGTWRQQFDRVTVRDSAGNARSVKGHIVATRFATEEKAKVYSGIWAEDPDSPGDRPLEPESSNALARAVIAAHYSSIATKLGQPLLASALASRVPLPQDIRVVAIAWRVVVGPLQGRRFIGGYFCANNPGGARGSDGRIIFDRPNPLCLDNPSATFFGVEESIFRQVVGLAREREGADVHQFKIFEETAPFYSGFSVLRDGSALGSLDFFSPDEPVFF